MRILFICTAFNSLSQRLALVLREKGHAVTVELALSPELMVSAAELAQPDIVVCPFLTKRVPREVYTRWLTLIVHPGPPHDAGPSALDFCLLGDDGSLEDAEAQLKLIDERDSAEDAQPSMRSHWGVTVLQAIEQFDAGPIWAFDQFPLDAETRQLTKSDLYRGPVTRAAVNGVLAAIERIKSAATASSQPQISVDLNPPAHARELCASSGLPFQGGTTRDRPLLKASSRDFVHLGQVALATGDSHRLNADVLVQRINCGDSQPGVLSALFGAPLFLYDACVQDGPLPASLAKLATESRVGTILATREGAVLVNAGADRPIWIAHVRKPKAKADRYLAPKLPAEQGLRSIEAVADKSGIKDVRAWPLHDAFAKDGVRPWARQQGTYQQVWVDLEPVSEAEYGSSSDASGAVVGYVYFEFYNGATATEQCKILLQAIEWTLRQPGLKAIVLMGGAGYFSNGIALNVIEGAADPSAESWFNINAIDDCVRAVLAPAGILTFAAVRANCAAGGLALATACDVVLCANSAVLNPHYRGLGLFGSEYHTYSWYERCGPERAAEFARTMLPMSATMARESGLVDVVLGSGNESPAQIEALTKEAVARMMRASVRGAEREPTLLRVGAPWTKPLLRMPVRPEQPLAEHLLACKHSYLSCLFASRSATAGQPVPLSFSDGFAAYRKAELDNMVLDFFHPVRGERYASRRLAFVRKLAASKTPARFALHRRFGPEWWSQTGADAMAEPQEQDEEELDAFDGLGDVPAHTAFERLAEALRAHSGMVRSSSQDTVESSTSDVPELAAHSAGPSPPDTPQPASPKEALDLQVESLALPVLVGTGAGASVPGSSAGGGLKAPSSITTSRAASRAASITFVPNPMLSESCHESAPRTAKVARLQHQHHGHAQQGRRSSRSISGFHLGNWGRKDPELLNPAGPEVMGLAILPSPPPPSRSSSSSSSSSAATRLFNSIARRSKASLNNLSQAFEARATSTERVVRRASMQLRRSSMSVRPTDLDDELGRGNGNAGAESAKLAAASSAVSASSSAATTPATETESGPAPPIIYACYYNMDDTPRMATTTPTAAGPAVSAV
ncbi:hypothetical protein OC844_005171 [Tilletia horrida]|nr:hypothetical protein OC844_005171 [Tilletia horrida]